MNKCFFFNAFEKKKHTKENLMEKEIIRTYQKDDLTIIWKPKICIHAGECVKRLSQVYKPKEKRWIQPEHATKEELIDQINHCPSGALSYRLNQ